MINVIFDENNITLYLNNIAANLVKVELSGKELLDANNLLGTAGVCSEFEDELSSFLLLVEFVLSGVSKSPKPFRNQIIYNVN